MSPDRYWLRCRSAKCLQQPMRGTVAANRIDRVRIRGKQGALEAEPTKIDFLARAFQAAIRHPCSSPKGLKRARFPPKPSQVMDSHVVKFKIRNDRRRMAGQRASYRVDQHHRAAPPANARLGKAPKVIRKYALKLDPSS